MIWVLNVSLSFLEILNCYRFFKCYLNKKRNIKGVLLQLSWIIASIFSAIININLLDSNINLFISVLIIIYIGLLFVGNIGHKILLSVFYLVFSMIIEVFMSFTVGVVFGTSSLVIEKYNFITYIGLIFIGWFKYIIIYYIDKFRKYKYVVKRNKWHIQLAFILLLCIVLLYVYINEQLEQEHLDYLFSYFLIGVIIIINIFQYVIFDKVEELFEEKLETNNLMQYFKYRESYYKQLELHQEEIRMIRHNLKNQLIAIKGYVEGKEVIRANMELESIIDDIVNLENICYSRNLGLNAILNIKHKEMTEKNIESNFEINIPEKINLSGRDIGNLVGNILDNAIEACEKCENDKFIRLVLYYYNHTIVIYCVNKTEEENKELKTRKYNSEAHGL